MLRARPSVCSGTSGAWQYIWNGAWHLQVRTQHHVSILTNTNISSGAFRGTNCEHCEPFHYDWPWRPAFGKKRNECKKCICNDHADKCHFDERVFSVIWLSLSPISNLFLIFMKMHHLQASGNTSGGVCDECQHNTEGFHCQFCGEGFYKDPEKELNHPDVCLPCNCNTDGTVRYGGFGHQFCASWPEDVEVAGQCDCKNDVVGRQCDHCAPGVLKSCERLKERFIDYPPRLLEVYRWESWRMPAVLLRRLLQRPCKGAQSSGRMPSLQLQPWWNGSCWRQGRHILYQLARRWGGPWSVQL